MSGTAQVTLTMTSYTSLGTGPLYVSCETGGVQIVAASSQPGANTLGHPLSFDPLGPFYFSFSEQLWGYL